MRTALDRRLQSLEKTAAHKTRPMTANIVMLGDGHRELPEVQEFLLAASTANAPLIIFEGYPEDKPILWRAK